MNLAMQSAVPSTVVLVGAGFVLIIVYFFHTILYNLYRSPLSRFPGPKSWAISRIPSQLSVLRGHTHLDITALHERYGPVVRIGPTELAFNSAQAFRDIYGVRAGHEAFVKDRSHYVLPPNGVDHLVSAVDNGVHARQRRLLASAFSERALKEQEGLVCGYVDLLVEKLLAEINGERSGKVDLKSWLNYTTFDITGDLMFGEPFDCLKESKLHPWIELIFNSIKAISIMGVVNQFPLLNALLMRLVPKSVLQKGLDHFNLGAAKVDRRLELGAERPDFISAILQNGLSEKEGQYVEDERIMSRAEIHSNAFILIIAGSETSATLLSGCAYLLCKHPPVMKRLVDEIRNAFVADKEISFSKTTKLPYLAAVIEESLRMYPPFVTSLARKVPPGGDTVAGNWIPGKVIASMSSILRSVSNVYGWSANLLVQTIVACHHYASYHSSSNFAFPDSFIPERWLDTDLRFTEDKKDVVQPFSLGPGGCLGKNLAYAEIRLILCKLLFNFNMELCFESKNWMDQEVYFLWDKPPLMVVLTGK